jgi:hypothetical protein
MHITVGLANTLKPSIDRPVMELNAMVSGGSELVRIKVFDHTSLPSCTDALLATFASSEHFHMDHIVLLGS